MLKEQHRSRPKSISKSNPTAPHRPPTPVYVPAGYDIDEPGAMDEILAALGVKPPQMSFYFDKGHGLAPTPEKDVKKERYPR